MIRFSHNFTKKMFACDITILRKYSKSASDSFNKGIFGSILSESDLKPRQLTVNEIDPRYIDPDPVKMKKTFTINLLREFCKKNNLPSSGNKTRLISRIRKFWGLETEGGKTSSALFLDKSDIDILYNVPQDDSNSISSISRMLDVQIESHKDRLVIRGDSESVFKARETLLLNTKHKSETYLFNSPIHAGLMDIVSKCTKADISSQAGTCNIKFTAKSANSIIEARNTLEEMIEDIKQNPYVFVATSNVNAGPVYRYHPQSDIFGPALWKNEPSFKPRSWMPNSSVESEDYRRSLFSTSANSLEIHELLRKIPSEKKVRFRIGNCVFHTSLKPTETDEWKLPIKSHNLNEMLTELRNGNLSTRLLPSVSYHVYFQRELENSTDKRMLKHLRLYFRRTLPRQNEHICEPNENMLTTTFEISQDHRSRPNLIAVHRGSKDSWVPYIHVSDPENAFDFEISTQKDKINLQLELGSRLDSLATSVLNSGFHPISTVIDGREYQLQYFELRDKFFIPGKESVNSIPNELVHGRRFGFYPANLYSSYNYIDTFIHNKPDLDWSESLERIFKLKKNLK